MNLTKVFLFTMLATGTASGLANADDSYSTDMKKDETTIKMMAPHATVTFMKNSSTLSEANKSSLRKLIRDAHAAGTIDDVTVAAWSDKALPAKGRDLLEADQDLASNRAQAVKDFLKTDQEVDSVETYSMAESANWLARTFNTKDAELKSVFGRTGADVPLTRDEFHVIKKEGGPSKAVAVIKLKPATVTPSDTIAP